MGIGTLGAIHVLFALGAILCGAGVILCTKGTSRHRRLGRCYAGAMLGLNLTALLIYRLFGFFGPFHLFALVSLATLIAGILPARRKRPRDRWLLRHYSYMSWSYLGLLSAFAAEIGVRLPLITSPGPGGPGVAFGLMAGAATAIVSAVGAVVIARRRAYALARYASPTRRTLNGRP